MVTPAGELRTLATPHTAAGPSLRELALGSEGVLGAITEVSVRVRPAPEERRYEGWMASDFAAGCEGPLAGAGRGAAQRGPALRRDGDEGLVRLSGTSGLRRLLLGAYLGVRRRRRGCLVICGWEGVASRWSAAARSARLLRRGGAAALARPPVGLGSAAGSTARTFATR